MSDKFVLLSLCSFTVLLLSVWSLDVSVTTLNFGGVLFNGFWLMSPERMYHFALSLIILTGFFLVCVPLFMLRGVKKC